MERLRAITVCKVSFGITASSVRFVIDDIVPVQESPAIAFEFEACCVYHIEALRSYPYQDFR